MQTIELQTTQNVTIEYQLASLGERIMALLIDVTVVFLFYLGLLFLVVSIVDQNRFDETAVFWSFATSMLFFLSYHFLFELLANGQSIGKKVLGIQVLRLDGEQLSAGDSMLRTVFYFVDLFGSLGVLGVFAISSSSNKQRLGDMAAGTILIKTRVVDRFDLNDILNISSLADYEPKYLEARQFNEHDMLLIKKTLARYQRYPNAAHRKLVHSLAQKLALQIGEPTPISNAVDFLRTLIRDYIVLTR